MRREELRKRQGPDVQEGDSTDRHAERVRPEHELEQRPGGDDGQLRHALREPPQAREDLAPCLDLVDEQERSLGANLPTDDEREVVEDPLRRGRRRKAPRDRRIPLQVALDEVEPPALGQVSDKPRLADLTRSPDDEGEAPLGAQPGVEEVGFVALHARRIPQRRCFAHIYDISTR